MTNLQVPNTTKTPKKNTGIRLPEEFGFRNGNRGTLTSRTIMFEELNTLLESIPAAAGKDERRRAIVESNILGKKTVSTRRLTAQRMAELYALDPAVSLFRFLSYFWERDLTGRPLLALLCASARDPLLRMTVTPILRVRQGQVIKTEEFVEAIASQSGDRFNSNTLHKIARNAASSWTQSGHLAGRSVKLRSRPHVTAANTAYALLLGYLTGARGPLLFSTFWMRLLDAPDHTLHEMARQAAVRGWLSYRNLGNVIEIDFPCLLTSKEKEMLSEQD